MNMKKFLIAAALLSMMSGGAFAQAGTPQGDTIVPNAPKAGSSNDMSRSPGAGMPGASTSGKSMTTGAATSKHAKKHKKKSKAPSQGM
jgi:hypothetical protein